MNELQQNVTDADGQIVERRTVDVGSLVVLPEQINYAGSVAAAKALAEGKSLDEAFDIGHATPNTEPAPVVQGDYADDPEPDTAPPSASAPEPSGAELLRRYLCARINATRELDTLNHEQLMDAAQVIDLPFISATIWKARVQS